MRSCDRKFLVLQQRSCLGSPSLFDLAPHVELAPVGARRAVFRLPSVGADRSVLGQAPSRRVDFSAMGAQFDDPSSGQAPIQVTGGLPPLPGHDSSRKGPVAVLLLLVGNSSSVNNRLAAILASHLRGKPALTGPDTVGLVVEEGGQLRLSHLTPATPSAGRGFGSDLANLGANPSRG